MADQTVLIISKDKDFSSVVAEQVKRELSLSCHVAETNAAAKPLMPQASLIITSEAETKHASCPVVAIKNPPIRLAQLLEEVAAQLQKPASDTLVIAGGYSLQVRQKQLAHASGKSVDLTDKEAHLLQSLAEAGSKGAPKDQLLKDVWGIEAVLDTHTLETHIYRLRGKCKELAGDELVEALDGGYRLAFS